MDLISKPRLVETCYMAFSLLLPGVAATYFLVIGELQLFFIALGSAAIIALFAGLTVAHYREYSERTVEVEAAGAKRAEQRLVEIKDAERRQIEKSKLVFDMMEQSDQRRKEKFKRMLETEKQRKASQEFLSE